jgi:hypothetical protein
MTNNPFPDQAKVGDLEFAPSLNKITSRKDVSGKKLGNPNRWGRQSYKDHASPFYRNYPGGFEGKVAEAKKWRGKTGKNFDKKEDAFIGPRLDPWTLNRKNLLLEFDESVNNGDFLVGGNAYIDKAMDKDGKMYSGAATYGNKYGRSLGTNYLSEPTYERKPSAIDMISKPKWVKDSSAKGGMSYSGVRPRHSMSEEMTHGAQPPGVTEHRDKKGEFGPKGGVMPYGAINIEKGAKFTNAVQDYILKHWGYGDRRDTFNKTDAGAVFDKILKYGGDDEGLKQLHYRRDGRGKQHLEKLRKDAIDFMMSTAQADPKKQAPAGFNYAPTRMRA